MLEEYVFFKDEFEEVESGSYGSDEAAEDRAKYLSKRYGWEIRCYKHITTIMLVLEKGER